MLLRADEDKDDVIESYSLYYIFSVFPSFVYYYDVTILFTEYYIIVIQRCNSKYPTAITYSTGK